MPWVVADWLGWWLLRSEGGRLLVGPVLVPGQARSLLEPVCERAGGKPGAGTVSERSVQKGQSIPAIPGAVWHGWRRASERRGCGVQSGAPHGVCPPRASPRRPAPSPPQTALWFFFSDSAVCSPQNDLRGEVARSGQRPARCLPHGRGIQSDPLDFRWCGEGKRLRAMAPRWPAAPVKSHLPSSEGVPSRRGSSTRVWPCRLGGEGGAFLGESPPPLRRWAVWVL